MNRVQSTERQPSMTIFSTIDGLVFIIFLHCVKRVQIRSYFWSVFSCIRTEYGIRIWTLFTQREHCTSNAKHTNLGRMTE